MKRRRLAWEYPQKDDGVNAALFRGVIQLRDR